MACKCFLGYRNIPLTFKTEPSPLKTILKNGVCILHLLNKITSYIKVLNKEERNSQMHITKR